MEKTDKEVVAILILNKIDYPIFKVKDGYVAIDENAKGDTGYNFNYVLNKIEFSLMPFDSHETEGNTYLKIIASTFPLEGVKRFEMADEAEIESQKHAKKEWPLWTYSKQFEACKNDFKSGYKAAQSKGSFTEEQVLKAIGKAQLLKSGKDGNDEFMFTPDYIINSLLPRYEVEMEAKTTWIDENQDYSYISTSN